MSAFLGPIHSLMYNRIITMQKVINALADLSKSEGWNIDNTNYVIEEFPPIEEVVDLGNIHASLSNLVEGAEERFAGIVATIMKDSPSRLGKIETSVKATGSSMKFDEVNSPEEICIRLQEILLDGMPCDRATMVNQNSDGSFEIIRTMDLHSGYFEAVGIDGDIYFKLLKDFVEGLLSETSVNISGDFKKNIIVSK
ncbi:hypothetical protein SAMN02910298_00884 [Pseudobutyrivibrio sp. YE44]|uniref:hypothetical protein n=1 Tax=Pseudobutyrivibrio sp. YE44 TaxID=1520802 RepID=UPI000882DD63|nr:hypothetical protein [Pseudobutyrivibrio sp. YE44]SDB19382.1 hypothetical protein SAMN02910298_00884 [Pseudobutyrivibrio sp. YE44]